MPHKAQIQKTFLIATHIISFRVPQSSVHREALIARRLRHRFYLVQIVDSNGSAWPAPCNDNLARHCFTQTQKPPRTSAAVNDVGWNQLSPQPKPSTLSRGLSPAKGWGPLDTSVLVKIRTGTHSPSLCMFNAIPPIFKPRCVAWAGTLYAKTVKSWIRESQPALPDEVPSPGDTALYIAFPARFLDSCAGHRPSLRWSTQRA